MEKTKLPRSFQRISKEEYLDWLLKLKPGDILWKQIRERLSIAQKERNEEPGYEFFKYVVVPYRNSALTQFKKLIWAEGGGDTICVSTLTGRIVDTWGNRDQLEKEHFLRYRSSFVVVPDSWLEPKTIASNYDFNPEEFQYRSQEFVVSNP